MGSSSNGVLGIGVDVADVGAVNAHDGSDVAGARLLALGAAQVVEGKELFDGSGGAGAVVLDDEDLVALVDGAGVHAADADTANVVGVVDGHALHGQWAFASTSGAGMSSMIISSSGYMSMLPSLGSRRAKPFMALAYTTCSMANSSWSSVAPRSAMRSRQSL